MKSFLTSFYIVLIQKYLSDKLSNVRIAYNLSKVIQSTQDKTIALLHTQAIDEALKTLEIGEADKTIIKVGTIAYEYGGYEGRLYRVSVGSGAGR